MFFHLTLHMIFIFSLIVVACIAGMAAAAVKNGSDWLPVYLYAFFIENLHLDSLLTLVLKTMFVVFCTVVLFSNVSNHIIISLDILYFESLIMLPVFHAMKFCKAPLVENLV